MPNDKPKAVIPKLMFTRAEASQAIGLSIPTIDRMLEDGRLKANRSTRRPLIPLAELERFSESPRTPGKEKLS